MISRLSSVISRVLFVGAFVLAGLAVIEKLANQSGYTVMQSAMAPSRMLELAVVALLFVIALQLRELKAT